MNSLYFLIPISLCLGGVALAAFLWSLKSAQYDDLDGAAQRILFDDDEAAPDVSIVRQQDAATRNTRILGK